MLKYMLLGLCMIGGLAACGPPGSGSNNDVTIEVQLAVGVNVTGTFTIELRDAAGSVPAMWSTTVDADTLISNWNSFVAPDIKLNDGQTYRIYMTRSDAHDFPDNNTISWSSSNDVDDEYPQGGSSAANANIDFTFRIYENNVLDQQMETLEYGLAVHNTGYNWQEFVPGS